MKKILLFLISLFILPIMVSGVEYSVNDLDLTIDIPDNYIVITRDNYKNNEKLKELDISEKYMVDTTFNGLSVYADAYDMNNKIEIFFIAINSEEKDTDDLNDAEKKEISKVTLESLPTHVKTEEDVKFLKIGDYQYYSLNYYDETYSYYVYDVYHVYNGIKYAFKIQSTNEFEETRIDEFNDIIKSVTYSDKKISLRNIPRDNNKVNKNENAESMTLGLVIAIAGAVIIIALVTLLIIKKRKKKDE